MKYEVEIHYISKRSSKITFKNLENSDEVLTAWLNHGNSKNRMVRIGNTIINLDNVEFIELIERKEYKDNDGNF